MSIERYIADNKISFKNGKVVLGTGHVFNFDKKYLDYMPTLPPTAVPPTLEHFKNEIIRITEAAAQKRIREATDNNPYPDVLSSDEIVIQAMEFSNFQIDSKCEIVTCNGMTSSFTDLETKVLHHNNHYKQHSRIPGEQKCYRPIFTTDEVKTALKNFKIDHANNCRLTLRQNITFRQECEQYTDQMIRALLLEFKIQGDNELNAAIVKQWFWQTKRYIMGNSVRDPLFLNFCGKQGTGKTEMIEAFASIKVLRDFKVSGELAQVLDSERQINRWTENYIVVFDELSLGKIEAREISNMRRALKKLLTSKVIDGRQLGTHDITKKPRVFSPISTTNDPMSELINDPTGMRRFYEMTMLAERDSQRVTKMYKNINFEWLWQGINEQLELGYVFDGSQLFAQMSAIQDNMKRKDSLDFILDYLDMGPQPVKAESMPNVYEQLCNTRDWGEVTQILVNNGLVAERPLTLRRSIYDYAVDYLDRSDAQYIPHGGRFTVTLQQRGFMTYTKENGEILIICMLTKPQNPTESVGMLNQ